MEGIEPGTVVPDVRDGSEDLSISQNKSEEVPFWNLEEIEEVSDGMGAVFRTNCISWRRPSRPYLIGDVPVSVFLSGNRAVRRSEGVSKLFPMGGGR